MIVYVISAIPCFMLIKMQKMLDKDTQERNNEENSDKREIELVDMNDIKDPREKYTTFK